MKSPNLGEVIVPNWSRLLLRTLFENNPPKVSLYIFANSFPFLSKSQNIRNKEFLREKPNETFFGIFRILCFFFFVVQVQRRGLLWPVEKKKSSMERTLSSQMAFLLLCSLSFFSCLPHQLSRRWKASSASCPFVFLYKCPFYQALVLKML